MEKRKNFGPLIKMVRALQRGGWVTLHPDSDEAKDVGNGLDLRYNQIMHLPEHDRWCYVNMRGEASIIGSTVPKVIPNMRLTKRELSFQQWWSKLEEGWVWNPWKLVAEQPEEVQTNG